MSPSLMILFTFSTLLFHLWQPIWAHMDPYGPVYHFMLFLYDLYVVFTWCLYDFRWFCTWCLICLTYLENCFYTYLFITSLEFVKDHFARPPAKQFGLLCNFDFSYFFIFAWTFNIFYIIDPLSLYTCLHRGGDLSENSNLRIYFLIF